MREMRKLVLRGRTVIQPAIIGIAFGGLSACDGLLDVELPHLLTDAAIEGQRTAETQVMSAIALFECGATAHGWMALGHEDVMEPIAGVASTVHRHRATPVTGACDGSDSSQAWFDQIMGARALISTSPNRLVSTGTGAARGVYDRMQDEWSLGTEGERLSAIAAIYMAASLAHMGEFLCEAAFDGSDLVTPDEMLGLADAWITNRALGHISNHGDFAMPNAAAPSARNMATALRARIRWARGDLAGATSDAQAVLGVDPNFNAWITREAGATRRNKIHSGATTAGFSGMLGVNDWWNSAIRPPNPATGQPWPDPIPFTGYIFLGIMPDGRALEAGNVPVRWAQEQRDGNENPVSLANGAIPDTRVEHIYQSIQGPGKRELPFKYQSDSDNIPLVSWRELTLIRADQEHSQGNLAAAITSVNQLRAHHGLPLISGAYEQTLLGDANAVRYMLLEERRREFYSEGGRYWSTKIQNTDVLWFPREIGETPFQGYQLLGGVRQFFPADEYEQNPFFQARGGLNSRGTGCNPNERPVVGSV
jgi:hypothetical protein